MAAMSFFVFRGTAKVAKGQDGFIQGKTHGYVCVASQKNLELAIEGANHKAKSAGFIIENVDNGSVRIIPSWRSWLPTCQGRRLREAKRLGTILTLSREVR
jgi:hypothetical protein